MYSFTVNMKVEELLEYREFDREAKPAPKVPFANMYNVDEVTEYVAKNGIEKPLELSLFGDSALLTDGNHRIVSARRLGYNTVPVNVLVFENVREVLSVFYKHSVRRFKKVI